MKRILAAIIILDFSSHGFKKFRKRALKVMTIKNIAKPIAQIAVSVTITKS